MMQLQSSHTHLVHDFFRGVILKLFASVHLAVQPSNIFFLFNVHPYLARDPILTSLQTVWIETKDPTLGETDDDWIDFLALSDLSSYWESLKDSKRCHIKAESWLKCPVEVNFIK